MWEGRGKGRWKGRSGRENRGEGRTAEKKRRERVVSP